MGMILFNWFTKLTGWLPAGLLFRTKIYYQDRSVQGRRLRGPVLLISNHTSVYDYAVLLFVFFGRTLRVLMAEVLFEKKILGTFLKALGGIRVDRNSFQMPFIQEAVDILEEGGVVGIYPESRIPGPGEKRPLEFKESAALIALLSGVPVVPLVTDGQYFSAKRAHVLIGTPLFPSELAEEALPDRDNIRRVTEAFYQRIVELQELLQEKIRKEG